MTSFMFNPLLSGGALVVLVVTLVIAGAIAGVGVCLLIRRRAIRVRAARERYLRDRFEGPVQEFVTTLGGAPPAALIAARGLIERAAIAQQLARYNTLVEDEARVRITAFLLEAGYVDQTIAELGSRRGWKRGQAALALGEFGASRSIPHLTMLMIRDRSLPVRLAAARSLGRFDDYKAAAALLTVLPTDRVPRGVIAQALLDMGDRGLRSIVDACDDDEPEIREVACRVVSLVGFSLHERARDAAVDVLQRRLDGDSVDAVRLASCRSLAILGSDGSWRQVGRALHHPNPVIVAAACDTAVALHAYQLAPTLAEVLATQELSDVMHDPSVARAAARALVALDADAEMRASRFIVEARSLATPSIRTSGGGDHPDFFE